MEISFIKKLSLTFKGARTVTAFLNSVIGLRAVNSDGDVVSGLRRVLL